MRRGLLLTGCAVVVMTLAGCGMGAPTASPSRSASPSPSRTADPIAGLSLAERVGQLFMVGTTATGADPVTVAAVEDRHVGGVFLSGRSRAGVTATEAVVATLRQDASSERVPLVVSTDQEGGEVQVLSGPGFDTIPSALDQAGIEPTTLESDAARWGAQLRAAGVDLDLAPVVDIVPDAASAVGNPPIGALDREYGFGEASVLAHAGAVIDGLHSAGVESTAKHFPGLGRVSGNTDDAAGVTDSTIDASSADVDVYRHLGDRPAAVMVSSAIYSRIDATQPACFSPAALRLLRHDVGFDGLVVTDDLSGATQVAAVAPGDRAIRALTAGVDVVLVSRTPSVADGMIAAVLAKAQTDASFRRIVDTAARRVVEWKTAHVRR